jgi:hypothetical protein
MESFFSSCVGRSTNSHAAMPQPHLVLPLYPNLAPNSIQDGGARACPSHGLPHRTCLRHGHLARGRPGHAAWPRQVERRWSSWSRAPTDFVLPRSGRVTTANTGARRRIAEQREWGGRRRWKRSAWPAPNVGASTRAGRGCASSRSRRDRRPRRSVRPHGWPAIADAGPMHDFVVGAETSEGGE